MAQGSSSASRLSTRFYQCRHLPQGSALPSPTPHHVFLEHCLLLEEKTSGNPREGIPVSWLGQNCKYHPIISSEQDEITATFHSLFPLGAHSQQCCEVSFQQLPEFLFWPLCWSRKHSSSFWFVLQFFKRVCDLEQNASLDTSPVCSDRAVADSGSGWIIDAVLFSVALELGV